MESLNFILKWVSYTLDTMTILYIIKFLFCREITLNKKTWIWCALSQVLLVLVENMFLPEAESFCFMILFSIIIIFLCYGVKGLKKIIYIIPTILIILLPGLMMSLIASIFVSTPVYDWVETPFIYFGSILDVIIITIINRKIRENYHFNLNRWDIFSIISANVLCLIVVSITQELQKTIITDNLTTKIILVGISFTTAAMGLFTIISVIKSKSAQHYKNINEINEYYMETQLKYFESYKNSQKETRCLKHDMKNHLICINDLCAQGKYSELNDYVKTLQDSITTLEPTFNTGNSIADSIINEKYGVMEKSHISFELKGRFQESCSIKPVHMCTIFANAMDNAIEACAKIEEISIRKINIEIKNCRNFIVLSFTNSINEQLKIKDNRIKTSKRDKENHGFGLENIRAVVEKYNGDFNIKATKDAFKLEVILSN